MERYRFVPIMNGPAPIAVTGNKNALYLADQNGFIFKYNPKTEEETLFLDLRQEMPAFDLNYDERGLFDIALTPGGRRLLAFYTSKAPIGFSDRYPGGQNILVEYDINTRQPTLLLRILENASINNGGRMTFGPDGYLYLTTGDGGPLGDPYQRAQNLSSLLGKVLRLDVSRPGGYQVPSDNPFAKYPGLRPEIYAYGFQNPWGICFDLMGTGYITDTGNKWEEVSFLEKGGNYGWNIKEGTHFTDIDQGTTGGARLETPPSKDQSFVAPIYEYQHGFPADIPVTISGIVGGCPLPNDNYIFGDYGGVLMTLNQNEELGYSQEINGYIRSFSKDMDNNIYIMTSDQPGLEGDGRYSLIQK
jgi:hypothetical protein